MRVTKSSVCLLCCVLFLGLLPVFTACGAEEQNASSSAPQEAKEEAKPQAAQPQGPPPVPVVVAQARSGLVHPQYQYIGSVYFPEVASVAAEVAGRVESYSFEEGQTVSAGQELLDLNTDLVEKDLEVALFEHKNLFTSLEQARKELARMLDLYKRKTVSEQDYDQAFFLVAGLENRVTALEAKVARLRMELVKSSTRAPFDGVVLERKVNRGEWVSPGTIVAVIARNDVVDVLVHVPEKVLEFLTVGQPMPVETGNRTLDGAVSAVIPRGDVATRTFPVKISAPNPGGLAQGMEARVRMPVAAELEATLVPRDAVLPSMGQNTVWAVFDGRAVGIPVEVTAYAGSEAAVRSLNPEMPLKPGMQVVTKGNERLRPGQNVQATLAENGAQQAASQQPKAE